MVCLQRGPGDLDGREHPLRENGQVPDVQQPAPVSERRLRDPRARGVRLRHRSAQLNDDAEKREMYNGGSEHSAARASVGLEPSPVFHFVFIVIFFLKCLF